tara:strand:- start:246 stop:1157 length:912 start_codon:yes stop_codon:yes gene_type:complete
VNFKKIWLKIIDSKKYLEYKSKKVQENKKSIYRNKIKKYLEDIDLVLKKRDEISFLHSGHLGDSINALPLIREISKNKKCNYFIEAEKKIPEHVKNSFHPFGDVYLSQKSVDMILPLFKRQSYLNSVEQFRNQKIDINLNFFREFPMNFNLDSVRWYFHLTGIHPNLNEPYLEVDSHKNFKKKIVIIRSSRRKNPLINYRFLNDYKEIIFLGLKSEFLDLKKDIKNLEFYDCKNFLEMAEIVKNSKVFIGNLSLGYTLAEGLKVPRLLESNPDFPLVYPNGGNGYDFYFQNHFENIFKKLYSS